MAEAYLNGILLDCQDLSDGLEKAVAVQEIPFSDQPVIQDMGLNARKVRLRCYFLNDRYADHYKLLAILKDRKRLELEHPDYGLLSGSVRNCDVRHDDREQCAEIDLEFVAGPETVPPRRVRDVASEAAAHYEAGLDAAGDAFSRAVTAALEADAPAVLGATVDPDEDVLDAYTGLSARARDLVRKVDAKVRAVEAYLADVATPANALIATIQFATDLPGRVLGAVAGVAHRYSVLLASLADAPDRFLASLQDGLDALGDELYPGGADDGSLTRDLFRQVAGLETGLMAADLFAADEVRRQLLAVAEETPAFDVLGNFTPAETPGQVMNVREIEAALGTARTLIADGVAANRANRSLNDLADALLTHVNQVKLEVERIVNVTVAGPIPLHLLCLQRGLPYRYADRLLALNDWENPNFVTGEAAVYVP